MKDTGIKKYKQLLELKKQFDSQSRSQ